MATDINQTIVEYFTQILGAEPDLEIEQTDQEITAKLIVSEQESGVLIGYRGETLTALQLILSLKTEKILGQWLPVRLDINDYRQKRIEALEDLAKKNAIKAHEIGQPISISNLTSYERRVVHSALSEDDTVSTHSEGDAPYRYLIITPINPE